MMRATFLRMNSVIPSPEIDPRSVSRRARRRRVATMAAMILALMGTATAARAAEAVDFLRDVRPILSSHCFKCHGPDEQTRKGGLRLDVREEALKPAKSGAPALVPGNAKASAIVERVFSHDEDELMPPPATKRPLTDSQKETLRRWVEAGAEYRPHWAFVPPVRPPVPENTGAAEGDAIDAFVREALKREGLSPNGEADRATLVRRVSLDLIGLPPTPEEADAFVRDTSPDAYERLVDRLLASRHYGERWARRWMDLARYADTNGYEKDRVRSMWPWRDWVIRAFNEDLPFDRFTVEQIAGDMLPNATAEQRVATGFHRNTMINEEGGIDPLEYRFLAMVDRVHTTATTWLGTTMACAQCHTHKYDPIQHREYFGFMALLDNADEPVMDVPDPAITEKRRGIELRAVSLENSLAERFPLPDRTTLVTLPPTSLVTEGGVERLSDGSHRFTGPVPDKQVFRYRYDRTGLTNVTFLVIEALADDTLPKKGPGRAENGNFVLTDVRVTAGESGSAMLQPVKLVSAEADFEQSGYPAKHAIDDQPATGWGISGEGNWNINRRLVVRLETPVAFGQGADLSVTLAAELGSRHVPGRLRLSFGVEPVETRPVEERRREHFAQRFTQWVAAERERVRTWSVLTPILATSSVPVLTIQSDGSVLASSDQTKSDLYRVRLRGAPKGATAIRLEALPDDSLPRRGPGRTYYEGPIGDFFLSTFRVEAGGAPVKLVRASQTHASGSSDASKALDEDQQSGWSIDGGQGRRQVAVFQLERPLEAEGDLEVTLLCEKYYAAGLGRFRLSVTTDPRGGVANGLADDVQALLACGEATWTDAERGRMQDAYVQVAPELGPAREEIAKLRRTMPALPTTLVMSERPAHNPRATVLRHRGEFLQPKERVDPGLPEVLGAGLKERPRNRLEFARWLVSRENPLTARVTVNRQWQAFFGRGLVRTMEEFGFQGELPTHPALLDWLAVEFMDHGWSQKALNKRLVMSAAYRRDAHATPELIEKDAPNRWLARGPRFRIEGELVRDLALSASGLLSPKVGGPSVFPPQLASITKEGTYGPLDWKVSEGEDRYRRGLYTFAKRTAPYASFGTFDAPSGEACVARREVSNTPLQALTLLNDEVFVEAAQALGRLAQSAPGTPAERAVLVFRRCLTRAPSADELQRVLRFFEVQLGRLREGGLPAAELAGAGEGDAVERAAWVAVARALLNLDETVTRG